MNEDDKAKVAVILLAIACYIIMMSLLTGCKIHKGTGTETHKKDSTRITMRVDTFIQHTHDSIVLRLPCSDSIEVITKEVYREKSTKDKSAVHDTIRIEKTDSIPYPVEVTKIVTKNSGFAKFCMWLVCLLAGAGIGYGVVKVLLKVYMR